MFGAYDVKSVTSYIDFDPAADDVLPVFRAPKKCTVVSASVTSTNGLAADGTNYFDVALINIGAAGTATTQVGGTIGGTAGWTALVPSSFAVANDEIAAGDVLAIKYNENGTGTYTAMQVQIDYVLGVG